MSAASVPGRCGLDADGAGIPEVGMAEAGTSDAGAGGALAAVPTAGDSRAVLRWRSDAELGDDSSMGLSERLAL